MRYAVIGSGVLAAAAGLARAQTFTEPFNDINTLPPAWALINNSSPLGTSGWFQGNPNFFAPQSSAGYIAANVNNTTAGGTISDWLITPVRTLNNGDTLQFWTRTIAGSTFPDRLQVRMSTAGASTNVGTGATSVGDFTTLMLDINPQYTTGGYPEAWTQYLLTVGGLSGPTSGRFAFRYFVESAGPGAPHSSYIGLDEVVYTAGGVQTGACCLPSGQCTLQTSAGCATQGGIYRGDNSPCATANCPQPTTGACCTENACAVLTLAQCNAQGGVYRGNDVTCAAANCPINLVVNGTFETGTFSGWTQFGDTGFTTVEGTAVHGGQFAGRFGPTSPGGIQQTLTIPAGTQVLVDFWLYQESTGTPNSFQFSLGGQTLLNLTNDTTHTTYTHHSYPVTIGAANPLLQITFFNSPSWWDIDDIHVYPVSTPCYANCDGSTVAPVLNVSDFTCFLNHYAAGDSYANCDGSTVPPVLNVSDFTCFLNRYAAGCP